MWHHTRFGLWIALLLIAALFTPARPVSAQTSGDLVIEVTAGSSVKLYDAPGLSANELRTYGGGNRLLWGGEVKLADGRNWMAVSDSSVSGWISPDNQVVYLVDPTWTTLNMNLGAVASPINAMTLYAAPGRSSTVLETIPAGTQMVVLDGPTVTDLYAWWQVQIGTKQGWIADVGSELQVIAPLMVYGYTVCDKFDIARFGVLGWDSIVGTLKTVIPADEQVTCLASIDLHGNKTPVVVVLASGTNAQGVVHDTLRIFEPRPSGWYMIYQEQSADYLRIDRVGLYDFAGKGKPVLLFGERHDGTGGIWDVRVLNYTDKGLTEALKVEGVYKGWMQVNGTTLVLTQGDYLPDEPNCCPSGTARMVYTWQADKLVLAKSDVLPSPYAIQVRK